MPVKTCPPPPPYATEENVTTFYPPPMPGESDEDYQARLSEMKERMHRTHEANLRDPRYREMYQRLMHPPQ